jgi:hypothetical protein
MKWVGVQETHQGRRWTKIKNANGEKKRDEEEAAQSDWIVSSAPFHFHFLE